MCFIHFPIVRRKRNTMAGRTKRGGGIVSGETRVMAVVARSCTRLDDELMVESGLVADALDRFHLASNGTRISSTADDLGLLARRWQVATASLGQSASALDDADHSFRGRSTAGCDHGVLARKLPEQLRLENRALALVLANFGLFDIADQGDRDRIGRADLETIVSRGDETGWAAQWILDQPDLFEFLDTGVGNIDYLDKVEEQRFHASGGDGRISADDIVSYIQKRQINRIVGEVADVIDTAAKGGSADGVLSRADYEAFLRSGRATDEQVVAVTMALRHGAVDGEQGLASDIADLAETVGDVAGLAALGLTLTSLTLGATGIGAPLAALTTGGASLMGGIAAGAAAVELAAGAVGGEDEHIVAGGIGIVTEGLGYGSAAIINGASSPVTGMLAGSADDIWRAMLEGTSTTAAISDIVGIGVTLAGDATIHAINSERAARDSVTCD